jgi:perosamine synthetase
MRTAFELDTFPGVVGTFMGRDALTLAASHLRLSPNDTVLLPAYSCKEVLRPFLKRATVEFYDVQPDLTIDPDEMKAKLRGGRIKALLIINYFGFLQPFRNDIKRICLESGTALIEDCAHSLLTAGSGETGDLVVYSFRKSLPVSDGGGLKLNTNGQLVNAKFYPRIVSNALSALIMAKSALHVRSNTFSRAGIASHISGSPSATATPNQEGRLLPMSSFARASIPRASFPEIIRKKREDFLFWLDACRMSAVAAPLFGSLPAGVCPLGFPLTGADRDSLMSMARRQGVNLMVHWRLPSGLGSECRNSHSLSARTVTLPIYPDLPPRHREALQNLLAAPSYTPASPVTSEKRL